MKTLVMDFSSGPENKPLRRQFEEYWARLVAAGAEKPEGKAAAQALFFQGAAHLSFLQDLVIDAGMSRELTAKTVESLDKEIHEECCPACRAKNALAAVLKKAGIDLPPDMPGDDAVPPTCH